MYFTAYFLLSLAFLLCMVLAGAGLIQVWRGKALPLGYMEKGQAAVTVLFVLPSLILLYGLINFDFSNVYIASYTDKLLPLFYRITAFWAGQPGSILFWGLVTALFGFAFLFSPHYKKLHPHTRSYFWILFFLVEGFFLLIATAWNNAFIVQIPSPANGRGLNPLLQNPGMIFHPPLLFIGYAGFAIPGCLALAQALSGKRNAEGSWIFASRNITLFAWLNLTAGIVLGAWWSYMELGWGGYWAWDPVENASLIPWLVATAFLHTAIIEQRREKLHRTNVFLMALTTISAFFATYLVRSGVVDSLHAFGSGSVGVPLLTFILAAFAFSLIVAWKDKMEHAAPLSDLFSREGFLVITAWIFLTLGMIILLGTMWPVFSKFWSANPVGLEADFYNRVCLPVFALSSLLLVLCPWLGWNGGIRNKKCATAVAALFVLACSGLWAWGMKNPVALLGAASSIAALGGIVLLIITQPSARKYMPSLSAWGVHVGVLLMALGIAFSGPYKVEKEFTVGQGASVNLGNYSIQLEGLYEGRSPQMMLIEAKLLVYKDGKLLGELTPQRRIYHNFGDSQFAEASTIPSLGNEIYATLFGISQGGGAVLRVSLNPLVNWLWIGGTLMTILPFIGILSAQSMIKRRAEEEEDA